MLTTTTTDSASEAIVVPTPPHDITADPPPIRYTYPNDVAMASMNPTQVLTDTVWAIHPDRLATLALLCARNTPSIANLRALIETSPGVLPETRKNIAILPLLGTITQRPDILWAIFGGTALDMWSSAFQHLVQSEDVDAIVLDVDSLGGSVYAVEEMAARIYAARKQKPIVAVANSKAASAAYWLASAASEFVVSPSSEAGSIGVVALHVDLSGQDKQMGEQYTYIHAGIHKVEGNFHEPLDAEATKYIQSRVDAYYDVFVKDVTKHRGVTASVVKKDFGQGRMLGAKDAVALGMADRVATMDDVISELAQGKQRKGQSALRRKVKGAKLV